MEPSSHQRQTRRKIRLDRYLYGFEHIFSLTITTFGRYRWFSAYPKLADEFITILINCARTRSCELYAWCVMPEHTHILIRDEDVVDFVRLIKGRATPIARQFEPGRRLWQRSFYDHALRSEDDVSQIARYIFENPVRAGLTDNLTAYRWSGSLVWENWREHHWAE